MLDNLPAHKVSGVKQAIEVGGRDTSAPAGLIVARHFNPDRTSGPTSRKLKAALLRKASRSNRR